MAQSVLCWLTLVTCSLLTTGMRNQLLWSMSSFRTYHPLPSLSLSTPLSLALSLSLALCPPRSLSPSISPSLSIWNIKITENIVSPFQAKVSWPLTNITYVSKWNYIKSDLDINLLKIAVKFPINHIPLHAKLRKWTQKI